MKKAAKYRQKLNFPPTHVNTKQEDIEVADLIRRCLTERDYYLFCQFIGECFLLKCCIGADLAKNGLFLSQIEPEGDSMQIFYRIALEGEENIHDCSISGYEWCKEGDCLYILRRKTTSLIH